MKLVMMATSTKIWSISKASYSSATGSVKFNAYIQSRFKEAQNSFFLEAPKNTHSDQAFSIFSRYGEIKNMCKYTNPQSESFLVEFSKDISVRHALSDMKINSEKMYFMMPFGRLGPCSKASELAASTFRDLSLPVIEEKKQSVSKCIEISMAEQTISNQLRVLCKEQRICEASIRKRFMVGQKIKCVLPQAMSCIDIHPFGSSVSGFGTQGCDLDIVIILNDPVWMDEELRPNRIHSLRAPVVANASAYRRSFLEQLSRQMTSFVPGFGRVSSILRARIPILKISDPLMQLDYDISAENLDAVQMTAFLYEYRKLNPVVGPLVNFVRLWAQSKNLSGAGSGSSITNFSFTLMVIFFLIQKRILPSIQQIIDRGFVMHNISKQLAETPSMEELLYQFFHFYSHFPFEKSAISLIEGETFDKPNYSAIYIQYPQNISKNVAKNVSSQTVRDLRRHCHNARAFMDANQATLHESFLHEMSTSEPRKKSKTETKINKTHVAESN